ncbi:hypothetical protein ACTFIR_001431 [Dictyostelium discoideum]
MSLKSLSYSQQECENGQPCTDFCFNSEENSQSRVCVASTNPDIDSTCQIGTIEFECEKPANKCENSWCATGYGCLSYDACYDGMGCTEDTCPDGDVGCLRTPIENCIECEGDGCISNDRCLPSLCLPYPRAGGTYDYDPCLINGVCMDGVCEYENICSSESQSQGTTTTGSPTTTTTTGSASNTTGGTDSDDYDDCKDLDCEKTGKKCKYLKSDKRVCDDHHHHRYCKSPKPICSLKCPPNHQCQIDEFDKQCCVKIECDDICDLNCGRGFECKIKHDGSKCCVKIHKPRPPPPPPHHKPICSLRCPSNHECKIDEFDKQCCVKIECDDICDLNCGRGFECKIKHDGSKCCVVTGNNYVDYDDDDDDGEEFLIYKHKKYPRRLGPSDCCPYTPTCY